MPTANFSALWLKNLKPPAAGRVDYTDAVTAGLTLRVTSNGSKTWAVRYKVRGAGQPQQRYTIGPFPSVSLSDARSRADAILQAAQGGIDLIEQEKAQEAAAAAAAESAAHAAQAEALKTVQALADIYLGQYRQHRRPNSITSCTNELRYITAAFGPRPISSLKAGDIKTLVAGIAATKPKMGHLVWSRASAFLNWAREHEHIDVNPIAGLRKASLERAMILQPEKARTRVLTDGELVRLMRAVDAIGFPASGYVRMLLLTGCRRDEVRLMPWTEWDGADTWIIPASRYKTGETMEVEFDHLVPLSRQARRLLETARGLQPSDSPYVFGSLRKRGAPISTSPTTKQRIARLCGFDDWTLHDLRRTVRTGMADLGVGDHVAERVIGHVVGSEVARTYNLHAYRREKAAALQLWADHLDRLAAGGAQADAAAETDNADV